jgi:hypothetical protein
MYVCIASGSKNHIELENSCGFIEPPPGKKYKKRSDAAVDKHAVYKEQSDIIWKTQKRSIRIIWRTCRQ